MSVTTLEPHIRRILLSTPSTALSSITTKDVRVQLLEEVPSITKEWIKDNKKQVNGLIASVFESVSGALVARTEQPDPLPKRKREDEDSNDYGESYNEEEGQNGHVVDEEEDSAPSVRPAKPKKAKTKKEMTDEEYARQLSSELNGSSRSSRSGKLSNGRASKKGASRTPRRAKKSAEHIEDSDDSDVGSDDGKKRKKKGSSGGRGGAKGGFQKEFILSDPLSALLEVDRLSRPQVVKQLWVYIKANNLQNPNNKKEIMCDDRMRPVFNSDKIDMFKMNKVLGQHLHEEE